MNMQRVQLDISSDIFDKVMFFLENLPKNKVKMNFDTVLNQKNSQKEEQNLIFEDFLSHSKKVNNITKFDRDEFMRSHKIVGMK